MQPQSRTWLFFIVAMFGLMVGHAWLRQKLWPPPPPKPPAEKLWAFDKQPRDLQSTLLADLIAAAPGPAGVGDAVGLAAHAAAAHDELQQFAVALLPKPKPAPEPLKPEPRPDPVALGGDD